MFTMVSTLYNNEKLLLRFIFIWCVVIILLTLNIMRLARKMEKINSITYVDYKILRDIRVAILVYKDLLLDKYGII